MTPGSAAEETGRLSALVLAGGTSRRLGRDKAAERVGARTLLERALDVARDVSDDVLLLPRARIPGPLPSDVRVVPDRPDLDGPLAGLVAGLEAARHPWCLLLPCDLPFAHAGVVRRLAGLAAEGDLAVVVRDAQGLQPFHGLYHRRLVEHVAGRPDGAPSSLRGLLESADARAVDAETLRDLDPALRFLDDVDTPGDLNAARASLAS